jgi:RsiW-degrading membrane proteinase PrsW (M82 family)
VDGKLKRLFRGSPLDGTAGRITLSAIVVACFIASTFASREWFLGHPFVMFAAVAVALALYAPTAIALWFLDRRDREPWPLIVLTVLSVIVVFGPLAAVVNDHLKTHFPLFTFVGLNEELMKVAPLLLLITFLPRAINGTRDGLIYGALGGFGFAIIEFAYYSAHPGSGEAGWTAILNQLARTNLLGTHNHVLWSAALGSAIGWAAVAPRGWKKIAVPLAAYVAVAFNHSLEDVGGNVASAMLGGALLEPILLSFPDPEATMQAHMTLIQILFGTVNVLMINIITLPVLLLVIWRSGETERRTIREQLGNEDVLVISPEAQQSVIDDRRCRSRAIAGLPKPSSKAVVQLQNELAFHKAHVVRAHGETETDSAVMELRDRLKHGGA